MDESRVVQRVRELTEAHEKAPEGIELWRWRWAPGQALQWPLLKPPATFFAFSGEIPPHIPSLEEECWVVRPMLHFTVADQWGAVGWEREARQAVVFFGAGGPDIPASQTAVSSQIDRLAEQGTAFVEAECAERFRKAMKSLIEKVEKDMREWGVPWEEQECMRELRERTEDW